jgi:hypothetical protein
MTKPAKRKEQRARPPPARRHFLNFKFDMLSSSTFFKSNNILPSRLKLRAKNKMGGYTSRLVYDMMYNKDPR